MLDRQAPQHSNARRKAVSTLRSAPTFTEASNGRELHRYKIFCKKLQFEPSPIVLPIRNTTSRSTSSSK
jgi:hypothetical protein